MQIQGHNSKIMDKTGNENNLITGNYDSQAVVKNTFKLLR